MNRLVIALALIATLLLGGTAVRAQTVTPTPEPERVEVEVGGYIYALLPDVLIQTCIERVVTDMEGVWVDHRLFILQPNGEFDITGTYHSQGVGPLANPVQGECRGLEALDA